MPEVSVGGKHTAVYAGAASELPAGVPYDNDLRQINEHYVQYTYVSHVPSSSKMTKSNQNVFTPRWPLDRWVRPHGRGDEPEYEKEGACEPVLLWSGGSRDETGGLCEERARQLPKKKWNWSEKLKLTAGSLPSPLSPG